MSTSKDALEELGYARKKMYCAECVLTVRAYMAEIDNLHTAAAKIFADGRAAVRKVYKAKLPYMQFPDE